MRDDLCVGLGVPMWVINLDRSTERLARMRVQADRLGITFERFPAVNGTRLPDNLRPYFCDHAGRIVSPLKVGEIGCYASHLALWRHIFDTSVPAALVCEDDAVLPYDLAAFVRNLLVALPPGWDFVHLCKDPGRAFRPLEQLEGKRSLVRYSRVPCTTTGYLISRAGAGKMLSPVAPRMWCVDQDLRWPWRFGLDLYGVNPPPVAPCDSDSTIGPGGRARLRRGLRLSPFRTPSSFVYNLRKLGPAWWLKCFVINCGLKARAASVPLTFRERRS